MKIKKILITAIFVFASVSLFGQSINISGTVYDETDGTTIIGALAVLSNADDSTKYIVSVCDANGNFKLTSKPGSYNLKINFMGYEPYTKAIKSNGNMSLGKIRMVRKVEKINDVVIKGNIIPVAQKGDTTEMAADAYKVTVDAHAGDLVAKMPGVEVDKSSGTVKAQGQTISRLLVDNKTFFGDDAYQALQNLPAEMVDKVQIFNKQSDQSAFTGFDDGQSVRVMNITTKADKRVGVNGTVLGGYGKEKFFEGKDLYNVNARLNIMANNTRTTVNVNSNNVGQSSFGMSDMISGTGRGGGGRGGMGGGMSGGMGMGSGLSKTNRAGINFTGFSGEKFTFNVSYSLNTSDNYTVQKSNTQNLGITDTSLMALYQISNSTSNSENYSHSINSRLEWMIDSSNQLTFSPRVSFSNNNSDRLNDALKYNTNPDYYMLKSVGNSLSDGKSLNYSGGLVLMHKFNKKGRTISGDFNYSNNNSENNSTNISTDQRPGITLKTDRLNKNNQDSYEGNTRLSYTEPISQKSILQASYRISLSKNWSESNFFNMLTEPPTKLVLQSNEYETFYNRQLAGLSYAYIYSSDIRGNIGAEFQSANLKGESKDTIATNVSKSFNSILPNANATIKFSKAANLYLNYTTSTSAPSVNDLNEMVKINSSTSFSKGNSNLKPQYGHRLTANYRHSETYTNYSFNVMGSYTGNVVARKTEILTHDTIIKGQRILQNGTFSSPVNMDDGSWSALLFGTYGFLFKPIKSQVTFNANMMYSTSPGFVNFIKSISETYNLSGGFNIASNINQNVDFNFRYNSGYNINKNNTQASLERNTWNHSAVFAANFTFFNSITLNNSFSGNMTRGMGADYNTSYLQWNLGLGKKLFKKNATLALAAFDILNQTKTVNRSVTETAIVDSRTNTQGRYVMLTFTYNLRAYKGQSDDRRRDDHGPYPGGGFPGGGMPGGGFPGGGMPGGGGPRMF